MKPGNIFLTGPPGCGKSTLIERIVGRINAGVVGFITREIREGGNRVGFSIDTFDGNKTVLAHVGVKSPYRVGKYGVRIEAVDAVAVPSLKTTTADSPIIIDEIGKMECLSAAFRNAVVEALDAPNPVVATIALKGDSFISGLKARDDVTLFTVNPSNRDTLAEGIISLLIEGIARSGE
jgi:nucleoside-triphosphatase